MSKFISACVLFGQHLLPLVFLLAPSQATSQIVPNATLPLNSLVTTQDNTSLIDGGTQVGSNLFHSFEQFSVPIGNAAYFNNALNVQNIISRVTGSEVSKIDGLIRANGTANLFLLNPNGFIFGRNASLNIGGSFLASSASSINFADGTQFSAKSSQTAPLLTISVPVGLQFSENAGVIRVQGTGHNLILPDPIYSPFTRGNNFSDFKVNPGQTIALVGGDVALDGGTITAEGARIELGSVSNGLVSLSSTSSGWVFGYEGVHSFKDVYLSQKALVDASGAGAGSIHVQGAHVSLIDGSVILLQNQGLQPSGSINVNAFDSLEVSGTSPDGMISTSLINETVGGNGGNIGISTKNLVLQQGGAIATKNYSVGRGGNLTVSATESTQLLGASLSSVQIPSNIVTANFGSGDGGNIRLSTGSLIVQGGAEIATATYGAGRGGNLTLNALDSTQVVGYLSGAFQLPSFVLTATYGFGTGGNIILSTGNFTAKYGGTVGSLNRGQRGSVTGGNVTINAKNFVEVVGVVPNTSSPSALQAATFSSGNAGRLTVNTSKVIVRNGGSINTSTTASGKAGNLTINASDFVDVNGNSSFINSSATIVDKKLQNLYRLPLEPSGASGDLTINTRRLNVTNGGQLSVKNDGSGDAGELQINANFIRLDNQGGITASTRSGQGGDISINLEDLLLLRDNSIISASARGMGNGGNITINTGILAALENSDITANAQGGTGGQVTINAQGIFSSPDSDITATGGSPELTGTVEINTQDVDPSGGLANLPEQPVDATGLIAQGCSAGVGPAASRFVVTGRGGIPDNPNETLNSDTLWTDSRLITSTENQVSSPSATQPTEPASAPLVEANSWMINAKGEVVLTATAPSIEIPWMTATSCHAS